jgi:ABC-type multidrug transport system permease subunit
VNPPGAAGTVIVYVMAAGFGAATALWSMGVALRARTVQAAPLMQLVVFMAIFTSVAYAPRELQHGWLRTIADVNPVTRILEASRATELGGAAWDEVWPGLGAIALLLAVTGTWALGGLRRLGRD